MSGTVIVTGARGQLGMELQATAPAGRRVLAYGSAELDVTRPEDVLRTLRRDRADLVINAAAYTAVDQAESEPARARAVNTEGAANVARAASGLNARLIQISTDFVFEGAQGTPYVPDAEPRPLNVYGATKLAGEREVLRLTGGEALVLRTAWLYSARSRNFVTTMLSLLRDGDQIRVVADQVGSPTWARSLAEAIWRATACPQVRGLHHWTDAGVASRFDFAFAIMEEALSLGLIERPVPIRPARTAEFAAAARRPPFSVLDKSTTWAALDLEAPHWRLNLRRMLRDLADA